jgi:hypothetical protein
VVAYTAICLVSDHPVCGAKVGFAEIFLMPQPPRLTRRGLRLLQTAGRSDQRNIQSGQVEPHRVGESHIVPERDIDGAVDGSALNCERQSQGTQAAEGSIAGVPSIKDLLDVEGYRRTVGRTSGKATASQFDRGRRIERERQIDHFPRHRHECDSGCKTTRLLRGLRRPNLWWGRDNRPRPIQRRKRLLNGSDC